MSIGRVPGATGIQPSIVTAKGDLIVATASGSVTNQAVGTNNQVLMADSAQADGVKWANEATATLTTTGDLLYASAANTPARLAIGSTDQVLKVSGGIPGWGAAGSSFVGAVVSGVGKSTISHDTLTTLTYSTDDIDTDNFHNTSTNTSRITIPSGKNGKYYVYSAGFRMAFAADNDGYIQISKNGNPEINFYPGRNPTNGRPTHIVFGILDLVATDYLEIKVYQASGGSLSVISGGKFGVYYLGA